MSTTEKIDFKTRPNRLNLGCGWDIRDGYLNVDFIDDHKPDLVADVRTLEMLPGGFYEEIIAQDILEHLEISEVVPTLARWSELLSVGGKLILRVPDIIGLGQLMTRLETVEQQQILIRNLYGTQAYTGDYHHAGFTELTLRHSLHGVNLSVSEMTRTDQWLLDCVAVRVQDAGTFEPGDLPFHQLCDREHVGSKPTNVGFVDRNVRSAANRLPDGVRDKARQLWRPARSWLVDKKVL